MKALWESAKKQQESTVRNCRKAARKRRGKEPLESTEKRRENAMRKCQKAAKKHRGNYGYAKVEIVEAKQEQASNLPHPSNCCACYLNTFSSVSGLFRFSATLVSMSLWPKRPGVGRCAVPEPGRLASVKATSGTETQDTIRETGIAWTGEWQLKWLDQLSGEDAPGPARRMEALAKVISQIHRQWGIDCKPKDFTLAMSRLLQTGIIDWPVDILHPEIWDRCTKALAEEMMSSGSERNLKTWGKVVQALKKALQEQETWKAA
ncbi:hypothetical protein TURU_138710 [Turdus rufiventris]|nr:hypothetical protein TURU_138710 [Turdus rufiventris]